LYVRRAEEGWNLRRLIRVVVVQDGRNEERKEGDKETRCRKINARESGDG